MIKGPKGAVPTLRGWAHERTGELLKSQKISQKAIDEWYGIRVEEPVEPAPEPVVEPIIVDEDDVISDLNEDGIIDKLESMTKNELEEYGREHGVELDRRKNKKTMIEDLRAHLET